MKRAVLAAAALMVIAGAVAGPSISIAREPDPYPVPPSERRGFKKQSNRQRYKADPSKPATKLRRHRRV